MCAFPMANVPFGTAATKNLAWDFSTEYNEKMAGKQINSGNYKFSKDFTIAGPGLDAFSGDNRSNGWCFLSSKNKRPGKDGKPESNWNSPNWKGEGGYKLCI